MNPISAYYEQTLCQSAEEDMGMALTGAIIDFVASTMEIFAQRNLLMSGTEAVFQLIEYCSQDFQ